MFWFFGHKACGILAPRPGIKPALCIGRRSLNNWTAREVPKFTYFQDEATSKKERIGKVDFL